IVSRYRRHAGLYRRSFHDGTRSCGGSGKAGEIPNRDSDALRNLSDFDRNARSVWSGTETARGRGGAASDGSRRDDFAERRVTSSTSTTMHRLLHSRRTTSGTNGHGMDLVGRSNKLRKSREGKTPSQKDRRCGRWPGILPRTRG